MNKVIEAPVQRMLLLAFLSFLWIIPLNLGFDWQSARSPLNKSVFQSFAYGNDTAVIGGNSGVLTSTNLWEWSFHPTPMDASWQIIFGNGVFITRASNHPNWTPNGVWRSPDGKDWVQTSTNAFNAPLVFFNGAFYGFELTRGSAKLYKSLDGSDWEDTGVTVTTAYTADLYYEVVYPIVSDDMLWIFAEKLSKFDSSLNLISETVVPKENQGVLGGAAGGNITVVRSRSRMARVSEATPWPTFGWNGSIQPPGMIAFGNGYFMASQPNKWQLTNLISSVDGEAWTGETVLRDVVTPFANVGFAHDRFVTFTTNGLIFVSQTIPRPNALTFQREQDVLTVSSPGGASTRFELSTDLKDWRKTQNPASELSVDTGEYPQLFIRSRTSP